MRILFVFLVISVTLIIGPRLPHMIMNLYHFRLFKREYNYYIKVEAKTEIIASHKKHLVTLDSKGVYIPPCEVADNYKFIFPVGDEERIVHFIGRKYPLISSGDSVTIWYNKDFFEDIEFNVVNPEEELAKDLKACLCSLPILIILNVMSFYIINNM